MTTPVSDIQAIHRVDQLIRDTANAISPKPTLELIASSVAPHVCLEDESQVVINRKYWLRGIPRSENMTISRQVRSYWEKQGHDITDVGGENNPTVGGRSRPDNFILALVWAEGDDLYLASTSPCVTAS